MGADLHWIKTAANELNNLLHVISESAELLQQSCPEPAPGKFMAMLRESVNRAEELSATMVRRLAESPEPAGAVEVQPSGEVNPGGSGTRECILIVDDEEMIRLLVEHLLTSEGFEVVSCSNGPQAIEVYQQRRDEIGLVILDFMMPIMDGEAVFDELRQINPDVPVVLSSGFAEHGQIKAMLSKGLRGFIPKPYTRDKLLQQVHAVLRH